MNKIFANYAMHKTTAVKVKIWLLKKKKNSKSLLIDKKHKLICDDHLLWDRMKCNKKIFFTNQKLYQHSSERDCIFKYLSVQNSSQYNNFQLKLENENLSTIKIFFFYTDN